MLITAVKLTYKITRTCHGLCKGWGWGDTFIIKWIIEVRVWDGIHDEVRRTCDRPVCIVGFSCAIRAIPDHWWDLVTAHDVLWVPIGQLHHQSRISSAENWMVGWKIFRWLYADWVGTQMILSKSRHLWVVYVTPAVKWVMPNLSAA